MNTISKKIFIIAAVAVAILGAWFFLDSNSAPTGAIVDESIASTTAETGTTEAPTQEKKELPPEPNFILPAGAVSIDGYAYGYVERVFFKSLTNEKEGLPVPSADSSSFKRLADFMTYPGGDVVRDCGSTPVYAFYVDKTRPYFYQIWRSPEFRASAVDAMVGVRAETFEITSPTSVTDGKVHFEIDYTIATSTCRLILNQT